MREMLQTAEHRLSEERVGRAPEPAWRGSLLWEKSAELGTERGAEGSCGACILGRQGHVYDNLETVVCVL